MSPTPIQLAPETKDRLISAEEFFRMGDEATMGLELVDGKIIGNLAPRGHQQGEVSATLGRLIRAHVAAKKLGKAMGGEVGIYIRRNPDAVRASDLLYISNERYAQVQSESYLDIAPELIVEVMSPADTWSEVKKKLRDYFSAGVLLAWIVDPATETITAYNADGSVQEFAAEGTLIAEAVLPGFAVPVAEIFA